MMRTEYAVQGMSRSTGGSGRWTQTGVLTTNRRWAEQALAARQERNGHRVIYRIVTREVSDWTPVNEQEATR